MRWDQCFEAILLIETRSGETVSGQVPAWLVGLRPWEGNEGQHDEHGSC